MVENQPANALPDDARAPFMVASVSEVVRLRGGSRFPLYSWRRTRRLALVLALGLPAIMLAFHLFDPAAAPAYIVLPVLAGGLLPLLAPPRGRFEIATEGDSGQYAAALERTLAALGYEREEARAGIHRYRLREPGSRGRRIDVRVGERRLEVVGRVPDLRDLQQRLAC